MKRGAATANTLGVVAVMYSGFGVLFSWLRGCDDELNTLGAATTTGMLFRSTSKQQHAPYNRMIKYPFHKPPG